MEKYSFRSIRSKIKARFYSRRSIFCLPFLNFWADLPFGCWEMKGKHEIYFTAPQYGNRPKNSEIVSKGHFGLAPHFFF